MDPKTISIGAIAVAALVVAIAKPSVTEKPTTELSVAAGGTAVDEAVTEVAKTRKEVNERVCELQREGTSSGIKLAWYCNGAPVSDKTQAELTKMAGKDGVSITFRPRLDGEKVVFDATIQNGVKPNLDPVPESPKEEPKPKGEVIP